ncbi:MAG TPA: hypothetical protein VID04_09675 [Methylomirabilota bacterium]
MPGPLRPTTLEVDLEAAAANVRAVRRMATTVGPRVARVYRSGRA